MLDPRLRAKLDSKKFFVIPGVHDMISTVIADRVGFEVVYGTGYWLTASALGLPDAGIASYTQMLDRAVAKVQAHIDDAVEKGARVVIGGKPSAKGGRYFEPTVLADVPTSAVCFAEETFGPMAPLFRFETEEEAVAMANDTEFGLAAYLYTRDLSRAFRVSEALETGIVGINEGLISTAVAPFGGVKASGLGREGSKYGVDDYLEIKYIGIGNIGQL